MSDTVVTDALENGNTYLQVPLAITGCILYIFVAIGIHHYKEAYHHMPWIHESSVACVLGVIMGGIIKYQTGIPVTFDKDLFFYLVLPPVIFSAGYSLKRKNFFKYMDLITFFGVFGTIANFIIIALGAYAYGRLFGGDGWYKVTWYEALVFSAVLTGSDEVSARSLVRIKDFPRMGALIFGEGVVNDAMSIVLFKTFLPMYNGEHGFIPLNSQLIYPAPSTASVITSVVVQIVCSLFIGLFCGLLHARLMRAIPAIKHFPVYQTALVMLFGYLSYCVAEGTGISGILTVFIAAIALAHYSWYNLSSSAQIATRISFAGISEIAEGFAFSYVGLSLWVYESTQLNILFSVYMIIVVLGARLLSILLLFKVCSFCLPSFRVPLSEQLCFVLGGVVRGCLCWAQILQIQHSPVLITTTLIIVMTTSLGSGVLLPMLLPLLQPSPVKETLRQPTGSPVSLRKESDLALSGSTVPFLGANLTTPERPHWSTRTKAIGAPSIDNVEDGVNKSECAEPSTPELHFAYEPFSADFPRSGAFDPSIPPSASRSPRQSSRDLTLPQQRYVHISPDPLDDLRSNEELIELIRAHNAATRPSLMSMLFWQWIRFDETFMKPMFGGSDRRYRLLQERGRQSVEDLRRLGGVESESVSLLPSRSGSMELPPPLSARDQQYGISLVDMAGPGVTEGLKGARSYGSVNSTGANAGSQQDLARSGAAGRLPGPSGRAGAKKTNGFGTKETTQKPSFVPGSTVNTTSATPPHRLAPLTAMNMGSINSSPLNGGFVSPGGRAYILEEDREDELELERLAEEVCLLDREMEDREGED